MKIKLNTPNCGWSSITLNDGNTEFYGALSYIQDVPHLFLDKFNRFILGDDVVLNFDEEGTSFCIILCQYEYIRIIADRQENPELIELKIWSDEIIEPVCKAINKNIKEWSEFNAFDEDEAQEDKELLLNKITPILEWCENRKK